MAAAIKAQPHLMKNAMKQLGGEGEQFKQMKQMKATDTTLLVWDCLCDSRHRGRNSTRSSTSRCSSSCQRHNGQ